jgi:hypothetical protein
LTSSDVLGVLLEDGASGEVNDDKEEEDAEAEEGLDVTVIGTCCVVVVVVVLSSVEALSPLL